MILISIDGLRGDFAEKYQAEHLGRFKKLGVAAEYMIPSFPSLTFPNHYTLVTGLYPAHHGLVDNTFRDTKKGRYTMSDKKAVADSSWYGGTPLWVLAEKQGMVSASFYWVVSESAIQGIRPSYYYYYNEKIGIDERVRTVRDWLNLPEAQRPHFISFYLSQVDYAAHHFGPDAAQTGEAVRWADSVLGKLYQAIEPLGLPVNYIVVSDHGMTRVTKTLSLPGSIDTTKFYASGETIVQLYARDSLAVSPAFRALQQERTDEYDVYLGADVPEKWHYTKKDDRYNRIGDILLIPKPPAFFNISGHRNTIMGKHGYDPYYPDMRASFFAWGPAFKKGLKIPAFENVHVFPLIATILGLSYDPAEIDGSAKVLEGILK